jgi:ribosomal-protein-alanine N-acetyltransferase
LRGLWKRLFQSKAPASLPASPTDYIAGYVSTWYMTDEAHITGIAVRESLRGNGLGELLLMASIEMAMKHESRVVTLEVRASNHVAQSLYSKYGFSQVGIRKGYYSDNREDAYIMTTDTISSPAYNQQLHSLEETYRTRRGDVALGLG